MIPIGLYLCFAFTDLEFDVTVWEEWKRAVLAALTLVIIILIAFFRNVRYDSGDLEEPDFY